MAERKHFRCAIYTRKSSDEGLGQDFNSLDAQREACAAYVRAGRNCRRDTTTAGSPVATLSGQGSFDCSTISGQSASM